jgi:hypothetical protein
MISQYYSFNREELRPAWKKIKMVKQQRMLQTNLMPHLDMAAITQYKRFHPPSPSQDKTPTYQPALSRSIYF